MKNNSNLVYDVDGLVAAAKKNLRNSIAKIGVSIVVLALSILAIVFFGSYLFVFICGAMLACVFAILCNKSIKNIAFSDYSNTSGEITDVHKEIKIVDTTSVGGINPFGTRKYDSYKNSEIRLGIFINDGEQIRACYLKCASEEHAKYYESKGEAIHIWGTHFPVKLQAENDKWLCPVCGEFNTIDKRTCSGCKNKIIK